MFTMIAPTTTTTFFSLVVPPATIAMMASVAIALLVLLMATVTVLACKTFSDAVASTCHGVHDEATTTTTATFFPNLFDGTGDDGFFQGFGLASLTSSSVDVHAEVSLEVAMDKEQKPAPSFIRTEQKTKPSTERFVGPSFVEYREQSEPGFDDEESTTTIDPDEFAMEDLLNSKLSLEDKTPKITSDDFESSMAELVDAFAKLDVSAEVSLEVAMDKEHKPAPSFIQTEQKTKPSTERFVGPSFVEYRESEPEFDDEESTTTMDPDEFAMEDLLNAFSKLSLEDKTPKITSDDFESSMAELVDAFAKL